MGGNCSGLKLGWKFLGIQRGMLELSMFNGYFEISLFCFDDFK